MRKFLIAILFATVPALSWAAGGQGELMRVDVDPYDKASLQNGAKLYINYCAGCHSAEYMRFKRLAADLSLPEDLVEKYLIFTGAKIGDTMWTAMDKQDAARWFGVAPPDLSLIARRRGTDWLYTYLNSFYRDDAKTVGWNNLVFPDVSMPHVLWELQGVPLPVYSEVMQGDTPVVVVSGTQVAEGSGALSAEEYRRATRDLVNFLAYVGEPIKAYRQQLGVKVMLFLLVFFFVSYLLKKEFWRDVH